MKPTKLKPGDKFGRLTVVKYAGNGKQVCRCDCGNETIVATVTLTSGHTKSCGCLRRERTRESRFKHGLSDTAEHAIWRNMIQRCDNPNHISFRYYGKKGVRVCPSWTGSTGFINFLVDVWFRPYGLSLDRIDNEGNYDPTNTRWADRFQQARNKRKRSKVKG